jgi:hypothetical protein
MAQPHWCNSNLPIAKGTGKRRRSSSKTNTRRSIYKHQVPLLPSLPIVIQNTNNLPTKAPLNDSRLKILLQFSPTKETQVITSGADKPVTSKQSSSKKSKSKR